MFTANLVAPIEEYLHLAKANLRADLGHNCLVPTSWELPKPLVTAAYTVVPDGADYESIAANGTAISCLYSGTTVAQEIDDSTLKDHRYRFISASAAIGASLFARDFVIAAIKYGLEHEELGWPGLGWNGRFSEFARTPATYDKKAGIYVCSGSILIGLEASGCC